jgi:hypothetical protein
MVPTCLVRCRCNLIFENFNEDKCCVILLMILQDDVKASHAGLQYRVANILQRGLCESLLCSRFGLDRDIHCNRLFIHSLFGTSRAQAAVGEKYVCMHSTSTCSGLECPHVYVPVRLLVGFGSVDMTRHCHSGNETASKNDAASIAYGIWYSIGLHQDTTTF